MEQSEDDQAAGRSSDGSDAGPTPSPPTVRTIPGVVIALAFAGLVVLMAFFAFGMPGMDHGGMSAMPGGHETLAPDAFAAAMGDGDPFVVNVHVPYEGEIAGTDDHIAHDRIADSSELPADRSARILLYCRSGSMSSDAAAALVQRGYTNVVELRGGMDAWAASGRALRTTP